MNWMTKLLRCIKCDGDLVLMERRKLKCVKCGKIYPIREDIPIIMPEKDVEKLENVKIFNELVDRYDSWFVSEKGSILFKNEVRALQIALKGIKLGQSMEIGVGTGMFAKELGIGYGLDPAWQPLLLAKKRGIKVVQGIAEEMPFKNEIFDTEFLIVTICFLENPIKALKEAYRTLRNGGYLIIGFVDKESPWGQFYLEKKRKGHPFYRVAKFYSILDINRMLKRTGFSIRKMVSALLQKPTAKPVTEEPVSGLVREAGFKIVIAQKSVA